jgi:hypothetical protein
MADVSGQLGPPTGGVDPHHGGAAQGGRPEKKEILGHVLEKDPDVEGAVLRTRPNHDAHAADSSATWRHVHDSSP